MDMEVNDIINTVLTDAKFGTEVVVAAIAVIFVILTLMMITKNLKETKTKNIEIKKLNTDKYNWDEHRDHFILQDTEGDVDFGEGKKNIFALPETEILIHKNQEVQMAVKTFGKGRGVYISGLPYSFENSRVLYRAVLWSASAEKELYCWYSSNYNVEVHAYVKNKKYCVVNNTYEPQDTTVYIGDGSSFELHMEPNEIKWYQIQ